MSAGARHTLLALSVALLAPAALAAAPGPALFSDRAVDSGLDFVHFNGMSGELYFAEHMGGGAALFDFDRDGDLDVYLIQGHMLGPGKSIEEATYAPEYPLPLTDRLYRNDLAAGPDGARVLRFVDVTERSGIRAEGYGMGVAAGDVDNDGWPDLYVNNFGRNQMLRNNGDGTFSDITEASGTGDWLFAVSSAFADFDRDGWLDLYVGNYADYRIATHKPCATQTGAREYCGPLAYEPEPDRLFRNLGGGRFEEVTLKALVDAQFGNALGVITADFDSDGWLDVYVANDQVPNQLWLNQRDGTFIDGALLAGCAVNAVGRPEASMGVVAADLDGDGSEDLFMSHLTRETNTLYLNDGQGMFRDATKESGLGMPSFAFTGFGTAVIDYDGDGWLDLFIANGAVRRIEEQLRAGDPHPLHQRNQLFRSLGGGRFEEVPPEGQPFLQVSRVSRGVADGDLDNDGDPDLVVANNAGPVELLINDQQGSPGWLGLDPRWVWGGRQAFGTRLSLSLAGRSPLGRRVRADGSYASSNDPRVLFGLGGERDPESVRVKWLGGRQTEIRDLRPDRYYVLAERREAP